MEKSQFFTFWLLKYLILCGETHNKHRAVCFILKFSQLITPSQADEAGG